MEWKSNYKVMINKNPFVFCQSQKRLCIFNGTEIKFQSSSSWFKGLSLAFQK